MFKLFRYLKPAKFLLIIISLMAIGQAAANLYLPNLMSDIVNKGISSFDTNYILRTGVLMALVAVAGTVAAVIGTFYAARVATQMVATIRDDIFTKVQLYSLHEFDLISTSSLITRTTNDTAQIQQLMIMVFTILITAPITIVVGIVMALKQSVALSWILVAAIPILIGVILLLLFQAVPLFTLMQEKFDALNRIVDENLTGARVVRAFNRIQHEEARFDETNRSITTIAIKVNQLIATMMPVMMLMINVCSVAIIWFGSKQVAGSHIQIGEMFAFLQYAIQILFSLLMVAMLFVMIPRAEASAKRVNEVLALDPEISDVKKPKRFSKSQGVVEFKDVVFSYHGAERPALEHISFVASPGKTTAIIGGTGSGKSTLVNMIPRFYDVISGQVLLDGMDVRDMAQDDLRQQIGFIPQKAVLFAGTVSDNIRLGKPDATLEEIKHAATIAQASEFISKMPEKYNALIAQGGTNVSGGQMQRLSIARALVRQAPIYIFDDTFSALDFKTDANLRAALKQETKNSTVIIVAQRVSTVIDADQIIVIDDGYIAGVGTHHELMKTCEVYQSIVSSQLSATEIAEET